MYCAYPKIVLFDKSSLEGKNTEGDISYYATVNATYSKPQVH
jgi:hypothetical protein